MGLTAVVLSGGSVIDLDGTFFIQLVIFFATLLILNQLVFRPLVRLFDARESGIDGAKAEAKALTKDASDKAEAYDTQLRKVKSAAGKERDRLRSEGQSLERTILEKVRQETQRNFEHAELQLSKEANQARKELEQSISYMAKQIAQKVLRREVA
ncbi:MAG: ATP synthase F0 subunit B [Myxococcales bacterium]|nr:MAG: ATP synthase F0 subunit B [Myxococcales bacterium]